MAKATPQPTSFQHLVTEIAAAVLQRVAPEELVILPETAQEFFDDPQTVLDPGPRDEALGFGLDIALLTPYVLALGGPVVGYLASVVGDAAKDAASETIKPVIADRIRGLLRRSDASVIVGPCAASPTSSPPPLLPVPPAGEPTAVLSSEQAHHIRDLARDRARAVGLPDSQADLLADAFMGCLCSGGWR